MLAIAVCDHRAAAWRRSSRNGGPPRSAVIRRIPISNGRGRRRTAACGFEPQRAAGLLAHPAGDVQRSVKALCSPASGWLPGRCTTQSLVHSCCRVAASPRPTPSSPCARCRCVDAQPSRLPTLPTLISLTSDHPCSFLRRMSIDQLLYVLNGLIVPERNFSGRLAAVRCVTARRRSRSTPIGRLLTWTRP